MTATHRRATALILVAALLTIAPRSRADDVTGSTPTPPAPVVVGQPPATDTVQTRTERDGPDLRVVSGGVVTFVVPYGIAVVVAATSGHQGDSHLYVPLAGPWLDLGDRGRCGGACAQETANRAALVVDGVFQALGVLSIISGFVFERTREVTTTTTTATQPTVQITPVQYAHGGVGLAAIGRF
jgi:hypothetical protein